MERSKSTISVERSRTATTQTASTSPLAMEMVAWPGAMARMVPNSSMVATSGLEEVRISSPSMPVLSMTLSSNSPPSYIRAEVWLSSRPSPVSSFMV